MIIFKKKKKKSSGLRFFLQTKELIILRTKRREKLERNTDLLYLVTKRNVHKCNQSLRK